MGWACQLLMGNLVDKVLAGLFPWCCVLCGGSAAGMDLCIDCLEDLPWLGNCCCFCALPLRTGKRCTDCSVGGSSGRLADAALAALLYDYPVDRLVAGLKFGRQPHFGRVLGELLTIRLRESGHEDGRSLPDMVVPVPLHSRRLAQRGYNQAEVIARVVARELRLPVHPTAVLRVKATAAQTGLDRNHRMRNLEGAFRVSTHVAGKRIAVVDDVVTTGATARQVSSVLRDAGAAHVEIWAAARTFGLRISQSGPRKYSGALYPQK